MLKIGLILQLVIAIFLMGAVLLQHQGTGLGGAFGSDSATYRSRRGIEKYLFNATIVLGVLFAGIAIANIIIASRMS